MLKPSLAYQLVALAKSGCKRWQGELFLNNMKNIEIWTEEMESYKLLDSGEKEKLEEIGGEKIVRKEPRAWWKKSLENNTYQKSRNKKELEKVIDIGIGEVKAKILFKESSKHIGIFPEQFPQWRWIKEKINSIINKSNHPTPGLNATGGQAPQRGGTIKNIKILNLFGYTGIASLVAVNAGLSDETESKWKVEVTHVDASKQSIDWAKENQKISGLEEAPIRWIVDDVVKFIKKEINRQKKLPEDERGYDAIIMDPPSYGRGPKGEVWKIEDELQELLSACREILSKDPLFVIFNMYSTELSSVSVANLLSDMMKNFGGKITPGELATKTESSEKLLPMSIFAIWEKHN